MNSVRLGAVVRLFVSTGLASCFIPVSAVAAHFSPLDFLKNQSAFARIHKAEIDLARQSEVYRFLTGKQANFKLTRESRTAELSTLRFQHYYRGVEVLGSQSLQHASTSSLGGRALWTHHLAQFDLETLPSVSFDDALGIARVATGGREIGAAPRLLIVPSWASGSAKLIYRFHIRAEGNEPGRILDVDAHSGKILADISRHWTIAPVRVYSTNTACQVLEPEADDLGGKAPISVDFQKCDLVVKDSVSGPAADADAQRALENTNLVLNYYSQKHSRDSFDGRGALVNNIVHIGEKWVNAFWDSQNQIMAYGDGDGKIFQSLTFSTDVAGHEVTHGVVSHSADLEYLSESGAINEGFADFFGESIEGQDDWVIGAKLFVDPTQGVNGIRNLRDPHQTIYRDRDESGAIVSRPAPAHLKEVFQFEGEFCAGHNDNCGVHMNATIVGHFGFRLVGAVGRERADKILYATLVHYLTATSNFKALGEAVRKACQSLYDAPTCTATEGALVQVGL